MILCAAALVLTACVVGERKVDHYFAAMRADIRLLARAQHAFYADHGHFARTIDSLDFTPATGVEVRFTHVDSASWDVEVIHTELPTVCRYRGTAERPVIPEFVELGDVCTEAP